MSDCDLTAAPQCLGSAKDPLSSTQVSSSHSVRALIGDYRSVTQLALQHRLDKSMEHIDALGN